jgi:hypothetical protein
MINVSRVLVLSAVAMLATAGCAAKTSGSGADGALATTEEALTTDNDDSQEAEDAVEDGVENGLSGATTADPGGAADGDVVAVDAKVRTNPALYFSPAGCLVSTRLAAGKWSHVLSGCTGPNGKVTYNGTVTSTWTVGGGTISVKHEATGFEVKGPRVAIVMSGARDVTYSRTSAVLTKHRVGSWTGTLTKSSTGKDLAWSHQADFTTTWDPSSKCYTRDGSATNAVGGRTFGRKVSGFRVCGAPGSCPTGGQLELDRRDGAVTITVTFLGGPRIELTGPRGNTVERTLACTAS